MNETVVQHVNFAQLGIHSSAAARRSTASLSSRWKEGRKEGSAEERARQEERAFLNEILLVPSDGDDDFGITRPYFPFPFVIASNYFHSTLYPLLAQSGRVSRVNFGWVKPNP